eukprot:CAMPEP_0182926888 /NCGR_PEP_ID=MMETSP0105_2-20130417/12565_1 /TAXON_ID=81532 ORGANISM="Acanthoeca-like sp., Strain 10tr" /NCGR_SAMPLE_ID=MMETSP0105_2 /ASSEMBLY_ACC=CAM_ASM_000205 /LENGTH=138 /DNA_ID=CAMNT_0025064805 /DNA_START=50 /DNA_END=466 /DNA_ORIENTATION=+
MWAPPEQSGVHTKPTPLQDKLSAGKQAIRYKRNLPAGVMTGPMIWATSIAVMGAGFYFVIQGRKQTARLLNEKVEARAAVLPCLQAEEDRRQVRMEYQQLEAEKIIMKDIKTWVPGESVYTTERHMAQTPTIKLGNKV